ncbi:hypothetical protein OIDMADRAFT_137397 [Oidiodendron maius Zn]|uniref:Tat pathway signal sequence n=1 Tax=Oidiodendron maius (strain Zn) TaxID=913774 RepID=A0A0C3C496_OIDMZ|nr:hypothetical protein OIDMADRAFT_137397 [Oidiodendron maius Zn]
MFEYLKDVQFKQLPQSEDCESFGNELENSSGPRIASRTLVSQLITTTLLVTTLVVGAVLGAWLGSSYLMSANEYCIREVSQDSPLLEDIDINFSTIRFNGSLFQENIFRQPASPEVDHAWESLGVNYRAAVVPSHLAGRAGLSQSQVQIADKYGSGFPANVEGLHHLHCLNLLRQALYYNFDYYHEKGEGAFKNDDRILMAHVNILRQQLMCTVDIGVLGQIWWNREEPMAYVDFNTRHKCRNFDVVRQWAFEHQAPEEVPEDYLKPPRSVDDVFETMP